jgi:hypothetical protein
MLIISQSSSTQIGDRSDTIEEGMRGEWTPNLSLEKAPTKRTAAVSLGLKRETENA